MMFLPVLVLLLFWFPQPNAAAGAVNYCHDEQSNLDWEKLLRTATEPEVKELYRLRKDLCRKVDAGELDLDTAIDIFETERVKKIESIKQRKIRMGDSYRSSG